MTFPRIAGSACALLAGLLFCLGARSEDKQTVSGLAWIGGSWQGKMGASTIEEHWTAPAGGMMLAVARVISPNRKVMFEYLRIEDREDGVYYVAQPNGRSGTDFKLTHLSHGEAVFENPKHDNPKVIRYKLEPDGSLLARTEGDEKGQKSIQEFRFKRKN
jgi:hypothetical protein